MRHVMVKIELDSRAELEDCLLSRVEAGRACAVCLTQRFSLFTGPGLLCSVCRFVVCSHCTAATSSLPSPPPPSPSSPSPSPPSSSPSPSPPSLTARLGKLFSPRRRSVDSQQTLCRPCSQFVEQVSQQWSSSTTEVLLFTLLYWVFNFFLVFWCNCYLIFIGDIDELIFNKYWTFPDEPDDWRGGVQ